MGQDSRHQRELVKRDLERELEPDSRAGYEEGGDNRSGSGSDSDGYKNHFDDNRSGSAYEREAQIDSVEELSQPAERNNEAETENQILEFHVVDGENGPQDSRHQ